MSLTKSVLCGILCWINVGCAMNGYSVRCELGVDNHVNFEKPVISGKLLIERK